MQTTISRKNNDYILYDADSVENPELLRFDMESDAATPASGGRGSAFFIREGERQYVLRHYRRGGLVARFLHDSYIWTGLSRTRVWREWQLLKVMRERNLPVPAPVAARIRHTGISYTADLLMEAIPHSQTLANFLFQSSLPQHEWRNIGKLIRKFHNNGIWHADLNAHNILRDESGHYYLIDFDRGRIRINQRSWQEANLQRLRRSLEKIRVNDTRLHFSEQDWQALVSAYHQD